MLDREVKPENSTEKGISSQSAASEADNRFQSEFHSTRLKDMQSLTNQGKREEQTNLAEGKREVDKGYKLDGLLAAAPPIPPKPGQIPPPGNQLLPGLPGFAPPGSPSVVPPVRDIARERIPINPPRDSLSPGSVPAGTNHPVSFTVMSVLMGMRPPVSHEAIHLLTMGTHHPPRMTPPPGGASVAGPPRGRGGAEGHAPAKGAGGDRIDNVNPEEKAALPDAFTMKLEKGKPASYVLELNLSQDPQMMYKELLSKIKEREQQIEPDIRALTNAGHTKADCPENRNPPELADLYITAARMAELSGEPKETILALYHSAAMVGLKQPPGDRRENIREDATNLRVDYLKRNGFEDDLRNFTRLNSFKPHSNEWQPHVVVGFVQAPSLAQVEEQIRHVHTGPKEAWQNASPANMNPVLLGALHLKAAPLCIKEGKLEEAAKHLKDAEKIFNIRWKYDSENPLRDRLLEHTKEMQSQYKHLFRPGSR
jgi:hypothetical protein